MHREVRCIKVIISGSLLNILTMSNIRRPRQAWKQLSHKIWLDNTDKSILFFVMSESVHDLY